MPAQPHFFVILLSILFISASSAKATPLQITGDLIYDEAQKLYWTKNAKLSGWQTWEITQRWISSLNESEYGGFSDWRLPFSPESNSYVTKGEVDFLYYRTLQLTAKQSGSANSKEYLIDKTAPFENLQPTLFWLGPLSSTKLSDLPAAWVFDFGYGSQFLQTTNMKAYAVAVRSASPVPEPSSLVLFLTGVFALSRIRSRSNH